MLKSIGKASQTNGSCCSSRGAGLGVSLPLLCVLQLCIVSLFLYSRMEKIKLKQKNQPEVTATALDTKDPGQKSDAERKGNRNYVCVCMNNLK